MLKLSRPDSFSLWLLWHCAAAMIVVLVPSQLALGEPVWALSGEHRTFLIGIVLAYLTSVFILALRLRKRDFLQVQEVALIALASFGVYFLLLLMGQSYYSRPILAGALLGSSVFILLSFALRRSAQRALLVILTVAVLGMQALGERPGQLLENWASADPEPHSSKRIINTTLYAIKAEFFDNAVRICPGNGNPCRTPRNGGGLSQFHTGYLVATGEGTLHFLFRNSQDASLEVKPLRDRIPINSDAFASEVEERSLNLFRVTDILVQDSGDKFRLFAAYHFWKAEQKCFVLRVSRAEGDYEKFLSGSKGLEWKQVYETQPCLPLKTEPRSGGPFAGGESGGRLVLLDDQTLLLSVGDHDFNGWHREKILAQDETAAYGKTILIKLDSGRWEVYSLGHRNPQGLYHDRDGTIWMTEHGPEGGDELNVVTRTGNYGWPFVTYGTANGLRTWPPSARADPQLRSQLPVYAWVPDIAITDLIRVEGGAFSSWRDDLVIASLRRAIWRVHLDQRRVVYVEPIQLRDSNARIRDLLEDRDGSIVLWVDNGTVVFLQPVPEGKGLDMGSAEDHAAYGQFAFRRCSGCHAVGDGTSHGVGPDLAGLFNRPVAGAAGYRYSSALGKISGTWTEQRLNQFLADPQEFAPGTSMQFEGISDPGERAKLIDYLKTLR